MEYIISNDKITVYNSFLYSDKSVIENFLNELKEKYAGYNIFKRSIKEMRNEWLAHNVLYKLHLFRTHTADVDIDYPQAWYFNTAWFILSKFSFIL